MDLKYNNMKKRHFGRYLILGCILILIRISVCAQDYKIDYITGKHGLSGSVVTSVFKDSKGFMWFGTQDGLNRYDGYELRCFAHSDSVQGCISGNYIRSVTEDRQGNLWVGTDKNGLNRYCRLTETFEVFRNIPGDTNSIPDNTVLSLSCIGKDSLLIGTSRGLYIFESAGRCFSLVPMKDKDGGTLPELYVEVILVENGMVWLGTDKGLFCVDLKTGKTQQYSSDPGDENTLSNNMVHCILRASNGNLVIGTNEGLNVLSGNGKDFKRYYYQTGTGESIAKSEVQAIVEDIQGNLWIGSFGGGVIRANLCGGEAGFITSNESTEHPLNNDFVYSMYYDPLGLLWVGTYGGGVNKLNIRTISFGHLQEGNDPDRSPLSNEIFAVLPLKKELWIGTDNGISIRNMADSSFRYIRYGRGMQNGLSSPTIYALMEDDEGNIWVGTGDNGINRLTDADRKAGEFRFSHISWIPEESNSLSSDEVLSLCQDNQGNIWAGTAKGLNRIDRSGTIVNRYFHDAEDTTSLSSNVINVVYPQKDGPLWIGTSSGLNRYNRQENDFKRIKLPGLDTGGGKGHAVYSIAGGEDGRLWIGTDNAGLFIYDPATNESERFTMDNDLPDDVIYGILPDPDGSFWISTNNGLARVSSGLEPGRLTVVRYNSSNGLPVDSYNIGAYAAAPDGSLYFGSYNGLVFFHPDDVKGSPAVCPVYITGFSLFFKPVAISADGSTPLSRSITETERIVLDHKQNVVQFRFAALDYFRPSSVKYAFMLEGLEYNWNYVEGRLEAQYLYIPPGEYVFRVIAAKSDGIWNREGASVSLIIKPPFTATVWFYLILAVSLILLVLLILHLRTRQLRIAKIALENQVEQRTSELRKANKELSNTLDELKRTQSQLVNAEKMASLGQLTAGVAHEINNPINFVSGNVNPLKRDVSDILAILKAYEDVVENKQLQEVFAGVAELRKKTDYHLLVDEIYKLLEGIGEGAARTAEIVRGLRNFSRLDEDELKKADINEGLEATLLILTGKLKNRIEVVRDFGKIAPVMCYPGQLNQVFLNILTNAAEAIRDKGTITISTRQQGDWVVISVKDTGAGMPGHVLGRIFEPFYTTKEVGKGTGLGLSISFGIIKKHNGTIDVKSVPGEGSEFVITLPVRSENMNSYGKQRL